MTKTITIWRCENCGKDNLGRTPDGKTQIVKCEGCGASIPANPHYRISDHPIEITDPELIRQLNQNANAWVCGYCHSVNPAAPANSQQPVVCAFCGTKFKQAKIGVHYYNTENAPHTQEEAENNEEAYSSLAELTAQKDQNTPYHRPANQVQKTAEFQDHTFDSPEVSETLFPVSSEEKNDLLNPLKKRLSSAAKATNNRQQNNSFVTKVQTFAQEIDCAKITYPAIAFLFSGLLIFFLVFLFNQKPTLGTAVGFAWESKVNIWIPTEMDRSDWENDLPARAYDKACALRATGRYEQTEEEYLSGYEQKQTSYSCEESYTYSCTRINSDGTADDDATCYGERPSTCYKYEDDYSRPIYQKHMVDDLTRPILASYCSYHIIENVTVRVPERTGNDKEPLPPDYQLSASLNEHADAPVYQYYTIIEWQPDSHKEENKKDKISVDKNKWEQTTLGKTYVVERILWSDSLSGYHEPTAKELEKLK